MELNFDPELVDPANPAAVPPKPRVWVAYLDAGRRELKLIQGDQAWWEIFKQAGGKDARGIVLKK